MNRILTVVILAGLMAGLILSQRTSPSLAGPTSQSSENNMVTVRVFEESGKLSSPITMPKVVKTDDEWKKILTPEQFKITRQAGTERPFCGGLVDNHLDGVYVCASCGVPLFKSDSKFDSGTGWPSFFQPIAKENTIQHSDESYGMVRTEVLCARCDAHLGHVFDDGPRPTGLRFCMNGEALRFVKLEDVKTLAEKVPATQPAK